MDHRHAFAEEIRENPHDDAPRLIYADLLEERGEPQAELIRIQVELSHLEIGDPARRPLELREKSLLNEHGERWLEPLRELGAEGVSVRCFERGLIQRVKTTATSWAKHGAALCDQAPALHSLQLHHVNEAITTLWSADMPAQIRILDLSSNQLDADSITSLANASWLPRMNQLDLSFNAIDDAGIQALANIPFENLWRLDLGVNNILGTGLNPMVRAGWVANLRSLELNVNNIGAEGAQALATGGQFTELVELNLASAQLTGSGLAALTESTSFPKLTTLNLRANSIDKTSAEMFVARNKFDLLNDIDLRGNGLNFSDTFMTTYRDILRV